jgi:hypothetical protein
VETSLYIICTSRPLTIKKTLLIEQPSLEARSKSRRVLTRGA